jgi:hypothetical protein
LAELLAGFLGGADFEGAEEEDGGISMAATSDKKESRSKSSPLAGFCAWPGWGATLLGALAAEHH